MRPHPLAKIFWAKSVRFGRNLSKITVTFRQNCGEIWAKMIRFGQYQNFASSKTLDILRTEAQPGFCSGRGLKMENFCGVILLTYFQ